MEDCYSPFIPRPMYCNDFRLSWIFHFKLTLAGCWVGKFCLHWNRFTLTIIYRSCTKKLKMRIKSLKMHGVWWLVVLIYTHVVYASMTILNCPLISDTHGTTTSPVSIREECACVDGGGVN